MRIFTVAFAALLVSAPALAQEFVGTPTGQEIAYIRKEQAAVRDTLKDPASATFSGLRVSRKGGPPVVCGYVNSKNSFGGYTGKQMFVSASAAGITVSEEDMAKGEMAKLWAKMC